MELQVSRLPGSILPKLQLKFNARASSEIILGVLFFFLWLAPTVRWRLELGIFSISFMEPVTLLVIGILSLNYFAPNKKITLSINSFSIVLLLFFMWLILTRTWNQNWTHGMSDLRDWAIPIITFIVLLSFVKHGWGKWSLIIIVIAILHSAISVYQRFTNSFKPFASLASVYKLDFLSEVKPSFVVGLFEHPNSLALFLVISILISLGWLLQQPDLKHRLFPGAITLLFFVVLYWTYAKAEILALALMLMLFFSISYIRSSKIFIAICLFGLIALFIGGWLAINKWPVLFNTIWWRISLWQSVFHALTSQPTLMLWGNGDITFSEMAIWWQPHNMLFDIFLNYGLIGLILMLIFLVLIIRYGILSFQNGNLKKNPMLRALWISLIAFMLTGFVESSLIGIETRTIFLLLTATFVGVVRESSKQEKI
jgi:hypothetical protein